MEHNVEHVDIRHSTRERTACKRYAVEGYEINADTMPRNVHRQTLERARAPVAQVKRIRNEAGPSDTDGGAGMLVGAKDLHIKDEPREPSSLAPGAQPNSHGAHGMQQSSGVVITKAEEPTQHEIKPVKLEEHTHTGSSAPNTPARTAPAALQLGPSTPVAPPAASGAAGEGAPLNTAQASKQLVDLLAAARAKGPTAEHALLSLLTNAFSPGAVAALAAAAVRQPAPAAPGAPSPVRPDNCQPQHPGPTCGTSWLLGTSARQLPASLAPHSTPSAAHPAAGTDGAPSVPLLAPSQSGPPAAAQQGPRAQPVVAASVHVAAAGPGTAGKAPATSAGRAPTGTQAASAAAWSRPAWPQDSFLTVLSANELSVRKKDAKERYMLNDQDLAPLHHDDCPNPAQPYHEHYKLPPMKLYNVAQVRRVAEEKYGGAEGLEAARPQRQARRDGSKQEKYYTQPLETAVFETDDDFGTQGDYQRYLTERAEWEKNNPQRVKALKAKAAKQAKARGAGGGAAQPTGRGKRGPGFRWFAAHIEDEEDCDEESEEEGA